MEEGARVERTNSGEGSLETWDWKVVDQGAGGRESWWVVLDIVRVRRRALRRRAVGEAMVVVGWGLRLVMARAKPLGDSINEYSSSEGEALRAMIWNRRDGCSAMA